MSRNCRTGRTALAVGVLVALAALASPAAAAAIQIDSLPYTINAPGDYVLRTSLTGMQGIVIKSSHVTLDLAGHALIGAPGNTSHGVEVRDKLYDVEIRNGTITAWGLDGIWAAKTQNSQYYFLRLYANAGDGMEAGDTSVVENVVAEHNLGDGIETGESVVVRESESAGNVLYGVRAGPCCVVTEMAVDQNLGGGVFAREGSRVVGNAIKGNGKGWFAGEEPLVQSFAGITLAGEGSRAEDNVLYDNVIGVKLLDPGNSISRNQVMGSVDNFDIVPGNMLELMLAEVPEDIEWPAVVTLAGTLTGKAGHPGIRVLSSDVTIDLGGHCLAGVPDSMCGILVETRIDNLLVRNGIVRDWGGCGVNAEMARNSRIEGLRLLGNAVIGATIGSGGAIVDTIATNNLLDGFKVCEAGEIRGSTSTGNMRDGIALGPMSLVVDSVACDNAQAGIFADETVTISSSTVARNLRGIQAGAGALIYGCTASLNEDFGILVGGRSYVHDNNVFEQVSGTGIFVDEGPGTRIEANVITGNALGLQVQGARNVVVCNQFGDNGVHWLLSAGTTYGQMIDVSAGGPLVTDQPWCNTIMGP